MNERDSFEEKRRRNKFFNLAATIDSTVSCEKEGVAWRSFQREENPLAKFTWLTHKRLRGGSFLWSFPILRAESTRRRSSPGSFGTLFSNSTGVRGQVTKLLRRKAKRISFAEQQIKRQRDYSQTGTGQRWWISTVAAFSLCNQISKLALISRLQRWADASYRNPTAPCFRSLHNSATNRARPAPLPGKFSIHTSVQACKLCTFKRIVWKIASIIKYTRQEWFRRCLGGCSVLETLLRNALS